MTTKPSLARFALRYARWLVFVSVVLLGCYCLFVNNQSGLRCVEYELDLSSGRRRVVEYYFWVPCAGAAEETWISRAITRGKEADDAPIWVTYSSASRQPSFIKFHRVHECRVAILYLHMIESVLADRIEPDAETEIAREIVRLWSDGENGLRLFCGYALAIGTSLANGDDYYWTVTRDKVATFHKGFFGDAK